MDPKDYDEMYEFIQPLWGMTSAHGARLIPDGTLTATTENYLHKLHEIYDNALREGYIAGFAAGKQAAENEEDRKTTGGESQCFVPTTGCC